MLTSPLFLFAVLLCRLCDVVFWSSMICFALCCFAQNWAPIQQPPSLAHLRIASLRSTGINSFEFEAAAPSPSKIPPEDLLGVTVILLTASYRDQEFIRVGYYVNNSYETEELRENPPEKVDLTQVRREVLVSKPRVTRFNIKWDDAAPVVTSTSTGSAGMGDGEGVTA